MDDLNLGSYISEMIGKPYDLKSDNCWHLASRVLSEVYSITLPNYSVRQAVSRKRRNAAANSFDLWSDWVCSDAPSDGALVLLSRQGCEPDIHVGVWIQRPLFNGCLHNNDPHGVVFDTLAELKMRGFNSLSYVTPA